MRGTTSIASASRAVADARPRSDYLRAGLEGTIAETPKAGDPRFARSVTRVIGGRFNAMKGAAETARALGLRRHRSAKSRSSATRARWGRSCSIGRGRSPPAGQRPVAVIASGETTVKVVGTGKGGRNQEIALSVAKALAAESGGDRARQHRHRRHRRPDGRRRRVCRTRRQSRARRAAVARRRRIPRRQQRLRVLPAARRPHHHRSLDDQRRRSADRPFR